jgi:arginine decarboxylase
VFPIMPIHRLNEEPGRRGTIQDVTCDSDGKIDRFAGQTSANASLELHEFHDGEPYMLGVFLTGAYQEILGDLHNLFGDTNAVHVSLGDNGDVILDTVIRGDTVREVLDYVQFNSKALLEEFRRDVETALREGKIGYEESGRLLRFYEDGLNGYTYLEQ